MTETGARALARLNKRECWILQQMCLGNTHKAIAEAGGTTEQAVKNLASRIFKKTGTDNRHHLVIFCFYHGIVECPNPEHATHKTPMQGIGPHIGLTTAAFPPRKQSN